MTRPLVQGRTATGLSAALLVFGLSAALLVFSLSAVAHADDKIKASPIQVTDAFVRAAQAGGVGGVFLTIINTGPADRLTGAASAGADKVGLHESTNDQGVMKMRPVEGLDVPAGGTVKLAPGGYHVMLMGLKQELTAGSRLPVTLSFQQAGKVEVNAIVVKPGAGAPVSHDMSHMPGMHPAK